jgi:PIN domain
MLMRSNVVLIDFESVQPHSLEQLADDHFRVLVFVGANQTKLSFAVAESLQKLGARAEYIKISGNGPNALDFHIAYYIGVLSTADPTAYFHIVSKDGGFDPLIQHLKAKKVFAGRVKDVGDIPLLKAANTKSPEERVRVVLDKLSQPKATKPRTVKTLSSAVASFFQKQLSEADIAAVIDAMERQGVISVAGSKVAYANVSDA